MKEVMKMNYFTKETFKVFNVDGLESRMKEIRKEIQPVFEEIHDTIIEDLNKQSGYLNEFHIAQHLRRTVHPPESTWCAFGGDKRGYKKYPHFQIQINEEFIFFAFAMIDNPKYEIPIAENLIKNSDLWKAFGPDFKIMKDHTKTDIVEYTEDNMLAALNRVINVKKGEIMVGRIIESDSPFLDNNKAQIAFIKDTYHLLIPLYKLALETHMEFEKK